MDVNVSKSKPDKPGELRNVSVDSISLVSKAANRKTYSILKMAKNTEQPHTKSEEPPKVPEPVTKDERGLFDVLKSFFAGERVNVQKGAVADIVAAQDNGQRLNKAIEALFQVLGMNRWGETIKDDGPETDAAKIRAALADFKKVAEDILIGKDEDVKKAVKGVQKSGRKISAPRLAKIKDIHAMLGDLIAETDDDKEGESIEVTKEELTQVVKESINTAIKPFSEKLEKLEKGSEDSGAGTGGQPPAQPDTPPDANIGTVVKEAVEKAIAPLQERLEKVEKARGLSNRQSEDIGVQKSADDLWDGVF